MRESLSNLGIMLKLLHRIIGVMHIGMYTRAARVQQVCGEAIVELTILQLGGLLLNTFQRFVSVPARRTKAVERLLYSTHLPRNHAEIARELAGGNRAFDRLFGECLDPKARSKKRDERQHLIADAAERLGGLLVARLDLLGGSPFLGGELLRGRTGLGLAALERGEVEAERYNESINNGSDDGLLRVTGEGSVNLGTQFMGAHGSSIDRIKIAAMNLFVVEANLDLKLPFGLVPANTLHAGFIGSAHLHVLHVLTLRR
ncbi:hypothetical protein AQ709_05345 [Burkholderia pseudomallei]|nr:hypothetical protein AQ709_05345 [Burkholderia pseudomallei]OMQ74416.1 hypothetical protein AQ711_23100 [Burkholderia pseudomallei]OMQ77306.1 hypothetical protein AQ712_02615 [Burkholderia pseudomallei]